MRHNLMPQIATQTAPPLPLDLDSHEDARARAEAAAKAAEMALEPILVRAEMDREMAA